MLWLVAVWSCAEACVFFLVADVPLTALVLVTGTRRALLAALVAACAAIPGALLSYVWASEHADAQRAVYLALPGIDEDLLLEAETAWAAHGAGAALRGAFGGVPFKLYARAAGSRGSSLPALLMLTPLLRLPRYIVTIAVTCAIAAALPAAWGLKTRLSLLGGTWVAFYAFYFSLR